LAVAVGTIIVVTCLLSVFHDFPGADQKGDLVAGFQRFGEIARVLLMDRKQREVVLACALNLFDGPAP
jgi:hypothetical protein